MPLRPHHLPRSSSTIESCELKIGLLAKTVAFPSSVIFHIKLPAEFVT
eukprot:Gb_27999 [translate_table: standard]